MYRIYTGSITHAQHSPPAPEARGRAVSSQPRRTGMANDIGQARCSPDRAPPHRLGSTNPSRRAISICPLRKSSPTCPLPRWNSLTDIAVVDVFDEVLEGQEPATVAGRWATPQLRRMAYHSVRPGDPEVVAGLGQPSACTDASPMSRGLRDGVIRLRLIRLTTLICGEPGCGHRRIRVCGRGRAVG